MGGDMCGECRGVISVLILLAGVVLYTGYGVASWTGLQVAGVLFVLVGLGKLFHIGGMCPMCNAKMARPMGKGK